MKSSAIDQLAINLWGYCVSQRPAEDEDTMRRWQTDELSHLKERFLVRPLPPKLRGLVEDALGEWKEKEGIVLEKLGMDIEGFLDTFEKLRKDFMSGGTQWQTDAISMYPAIRGAVKNLDWVNLFSWILPLADREKRESHKATGRMVTAIFYIELLARFNDYTTSSASLNRIEARWQLVNEL